MGGKWPEDTLDFGEVFFPRVAVSFSTHVINYPIGFNIHDHELRNWVM